MKTGEARKMVNSPHLIIIFPFYGQLCGSDQFNLPPHPTTPLFLSFFMMMMMVVLGQHTERKLT